MILAIHIGNTAVTVGGFEGQDQRFIGTLTADQRTADEYGIALRGLLHLHGADQTPTGAIIASVVPPLTQPLLAAVTQLVGRRPLLVGPGVKTGLNLAVENPNQVGSDLVVTAVAAAARYPLPLVVVSMGTATSFSVVDGKGSFRGGIIAPGVQISYDALIQSASMLTPTVLSAPKSVIGSNTADCLRSGCVLGSAAMIDGLLDQIEREIGTTVGVIATGGLAKLITPYCRRKITVDEHLTLKGLVYLYEKNVRR